MKGGCALIKERDNCCESLASVNANAVTVLTPPRGGHCSESIAYVHSLNPDKDLRQVLPFTLYKGERWGTEGTGSLPPITEIWLQSSCS